MHVFGSSGEDSKRGYPEETPKARGEHVTSEHTGEAGIKPQRF